MEMANGASTAANPRYFQVVERAINEKMAAAGLAYFDVLPLSLEEIFIYELGGVNDAVKNILL